jgi:hypothetical protein
MIQSQGSSRWERWVSVPIFTLVPVNGINPQASFQPWTVLCQRSSAPTLGLTCYCWFSWSVSTSLLWACFQGPNQDRGFIISSEMKPDPDCPNSQEYYSLGLWTQLWYSNPFTRSSEPLTNQSLWLIVSLCLQTNPLPPSQPLLLGRLQVLPETGTIYTGPLFHEPWRQEPNCQLWIKTWRRVIWPPGP